MNTPDSLVEYSNTLTPFLNALCSGKRLNTEETELAFSYIMGGRIPHEQVAAFLIALRMQGETQTELVGAVTALRKRMVTVPNVPPNTIDVCGTGGDNYGTLNVSTATAFVLAALGVPVAKHGNRAISSKTGASDVLEALGILPKSDPLELSGQLQAHKLTFLAAPYHHPAMRHAAPVRKSLGVRTLFNLVGPLINPAQVKRQLIGVFSKDWLITLVDVLALLGSENVWAVCGQPSGSLQGIDEITLAGPTDIIAFENNRKIHVVLEPEMAGFSPQPITAIAGAGPEFNAQALLALLSGASGPYRDTVLLNAACGLHVAGHANLLRGSEIDQATLKESVSRASRSLDDGSALAVLNSLRKSSSTTHAVNVTG